MDMDMDEVNERSSCTLVLSFTDESREPVTPDSGSYRIDTISRIPVKALTEFTPVAATHEIAIPANENIILNPDNAFETRIVTVTWTKGALTKTEEYRYQVKNLMMIS